MQARPCFKCGDRHWPDEPCKGEKAVAKPAPVTTAPKAKATGGFDRAAYQREYMRTYLPRWRARKKTPQA